MFKIDKAPATSFLTACEEGSIRAAAQRLGAEPSTISRHIKTLEIVLNIALIERGRRGVKPTQAGQMFHAYLKRQQSDQEALLSEFDALSGMRRGEIIVAVGDGFISDFITNAMKSYKRLYPELTYNLVHGSTEQVLHAVRTDHAHIGLAYNARPERGIRTIKRMDQPLQLLLSPQSQWAALDEPIPMDILATLPCARLKAGSGVGDLIRAAEGVYGIRLTTTVKSSSLAVLRNFVREGLGVAILPGFVATREIEDGMIMTKCLDIPEFAKGQASVFTRTGRRLPEAASRLAEHVGKTMVAFSPIKSSIASRVQGENQTNWPKV